MGRGSWRWARLLLHTGHLCGDVCKGIIGLVLLNGLVEMPAAATPSSTTPGAAVPSTTARVQRASAHAVSPTSSAASHSGELIAEVANVVRPAEGRTPVLEGCMQAGVVVPTLLCKCRARLLLRAGHFDDAILDRCIVLALLSDLVETPAAGVPAPM